MTFWQKAKKIAQKLGKVTVDTAGRIWSEVVGICKLAANFVPIVLTGAVALVLCFTELEAQHRPQTREERRTLGAARQVMSSMVERELRGIEGSSPDTTSASIPDHVSTTVRDTSPSLLEPRTQTR
jgi:hypothetical protein